MYKPIIKCEDYSLFNADLIMVKITEINNLRKKMCHIQTNLYELLMLASYRRMIEVFPVRVPLASPKDR